MENRSSHSQGSSTNHSLAGVGPKHAGPKTSTAHPNSRGFERSPPAWERKTDQPLLFEGAAHLLRVEGPDILLRIAAVPQEVRNSGPTKKTTASGRNAGRRSPGRA